MWGSLDGALTENEWWDSRGTGLAVIDVNKHSLLSLHGVRPQAAAATKKTPQDVTEVSASTDEICSLS